MRLSGANKRSAFWVVILAAWIFGVVSFFGRIERVEERPYQFADIGSYTALRPELEGVATAGFVSRLSSRPKSARQFFAAQYQVFPTVLTYVHSGERDFRRMSRRLADQPAWICFCDKKGFENKLLDAVRSRADGPLQVTRIDGTPLLVVVQSSEVGESSSP